MQYEKWLWFWIDNYVKPTAKNNTYSRYSQLMRNHIIPNFGTYDLNALSPLDIQAMVTKLLENGNTKTGAGLSSNTVNSVISVIQNSLYMAYSVGETSTYVGNKIKRPKISEKQVACFSIEEQKKIEQYVLNHKKDKLFGIVLCLYTGLRIGELLALEWTDIVVLQQGHMDPRKPLTLDNTIPQCQYCNQTYQEDFMFNEYGRVVAINNPHVVLKSPKCIQDEMIQILLEVRKNKNSED